MAVPARSVARASSRLVHQCSRRTSQTTFLTQYRYCANNSFGPQINPGVGPQSADEGSEKEQSHKHNDSSYTSTAFKMFESAATTFASLAVLA